MIHGLLYMLKIDEYNNQVHHFRFCFEIAYLIFYLQGENIAAVSDFGSVGFWQSALFFSRTGNL